MTPERHARIMELFGKTVELPPVERARFLNRACGYDKALRSEVESLLVHHQVPSPLDEPACAGIDVATFAAGDSTDGDALPETIGEFRILKVLGQGGMGVVYQAQQEKPSRKVALKLLRPGIRTTASQRRFETEIETLAMLHHPGIASIYGTGTVLTPAGPQPYIVMEYVAGAPLLHFANARLLKRATRIDLLIRICEVIAYAHDRGVIHRDLKPANILVEEIGGIPQPRILDFGVARLTNRPAGLTGTTEPGEAVGTLGYMCPEQAAGDPQAASTMADVYSLGAIAYQLLTGKLPIDVAGSSAYAAMKAVQEVTPKPLTAHDPTLNGDLNVIVLKALAKDRNERYRSPLELADDLRHFQRNEPVQARSPTPLYSMRKFAARHRVLVGGAALLVFSLVAGIAGTSYGLFQARQSARELQTQVRQTTETASALAHNVITQLDAIAGTSDVRQIMAKVLEPQVTDLLQRDPHNRVLRATKADILTQLSDIQLGRHNFHDALDLRMQALALREELVRETPTDPNAQAELSISLVKVGDVSKDQGDPNAAQGWYERAFAIDEGLASEYPTSRHYLDNQAWSCGRLSALALGRADPSTAQTLLDRRTALNDRLLKLDPNNLTTLDGVLDTEGLLSRLKESTGDFSSAVAHKRAALAAAQELVRRNEHNSLYLHDEAASWIGLADLLSTDVAAARECYAEGLARARRLLELEPGNARLRHLRWYALYKWGNLEAEHNGTAKAITLLTEARDLYRCGELPPPSCQRDAEEVGSTLVRLREALVNEDAGPDSAPAR